METLDFYADAYAFSEAAAGVVQLPLTSIALDGIIYAIDLEQMQHSSQSTFRDSTVTGETPSDSLFNMNGSWARYRTTWHHGADQEIADLRDDVDLYRYESSTGIDPWTENQLTLQHAVTLSHAAVGQCLVLEANGVLVHTSNGGVYRSTDGGANWSGVTGMGSVTVNDVTTDGLSIFWATSGGIYVQASAGASATLFGASTATVQSIAFVAGRLLVGRDNVLEEVAAAGTRSTIKTHFQSAFRWNVIFAIGSKIYIGGSAGTRAELYTVAVDSSGNLVQASEAAAFTHDEILRRAFSYAGIAVLCTSKGVRLARVADDGSLVYGALIDDIGDCHGAAADGRFVWVAYTDHPGGGGGIARLALDVSTQPLTPAWATDLVCPVAGTVDAVAVIGSTVLFGVNDSGVYQAAATYVTTGQLDSGRLSFGTVEPKHLVELIVTTEPLAAGESVEADVIDEHGDVVASGVAAAVGTEELVMALDGLEVQHCHVVLRLRGSGASTPTVRQWRLRAYPVAPPVTQWIIPLRLRQTSTIGDGEGEPLALDVITELDRIATWYRSKDRITFQIADRAYGVRVDEFEFSKVMWDDAQSFLEGTCTVRLVEV